MSSDAGSAATPFTAVGRIEPHPPSGFELRRDDFGAFRALVPGTSDLVVLRPATEGLWLERREDRELVPWTAVEALALTFTEAGRARVPTVRVRLSDGPSLDYADALAPGADGLPLTLGPGQGLLLRVERCRMLTAVIASAAGLAPATPQSFHRGPRGVPVPELATRPRQWSRAAPFVLPLSAAASVAAFVWVFEVQWTTAILVTAVFFVHEMGHALAMRAFGMKVRGVVFVPLLGAATVPEHSFSTRWNEACVTLAGPATGLPTAGVLALVLWGRPAWMSGGSLVMALLWALAVNVLNLVPILPLDGGRILACLLGGASLRVRAVVSFVLIFSIAALLILAAPGSVGFAAAVFLALAVSLTRISLRRQAFLGWMERLPQPLGAIRAALRDVTQGFSGRAQEDVDGGVTPTPLSPRQTVFILTIYAVECAALAGAVVAFVAALPPGVFDG